jgi:hypothetical protein
MINKIISAFRSFGEAFARTIEVASYSRAATELTRQGQHAAAKRLMLEIGRVQERS